MVKISANVETTSNEPETVVEKLATMFTASCFPILILGESYKYKFSVQGQRAFDFALHFSPI